MKEKQEWMTKQDFYEANRAVKGFYMENYEKKGYLKKDFQVFHLYDTEGLEVSCHYHDFDKIVLFLGGDVDYFVEGRRYSLRPYDIVLVGAGEIHYPIVREKIPYERIILYLSSSFLSAWRTDTCDLSRCFREAGENGEKHPYVLRIEHPEQSGLYRICQELEKSFQSNEYAAELYQHALILEFMVLINRAILNHHVSSLQNAVSNEKIAEILDYINAHLKEELSVDSLTGHFYMSRSYLMHLFKAETGYSLGAYINEKRLLAAKIMIQAGASVTDACYGCGFRDYSTFSRAFRKKFQTTPRNAVKIR